MQHDETTAAARLVLSFGDLVLRSIPIVKNLITIGRRPYNDIALDDLTVSGEHAVITRDGASRVVKDLNSRNGTLVNGHAIRSRPLEHGDLIEVGIYRLRYLENRGEEQAGGDQPGLRAVLETLSGPERGAERVLDRPIVSVNGGANQVAVVSRRRNGYHITHLEGLAFPLVNGEPIGLVSHPLRDGDLIELSGTMLKFRVRPAGGHR
jgi:pSer/pThr/pTyr-binding forkhead associated (FHA) protein